MRVTVGGVVSGTVVSMTKVLAELRPELPAVSDCAAWAVYVPSANAGDASTANEPLEAFADKVSMSVPPTFDPW